MITATVALVVGLIATFGFGILIGAAMTHMNSRGKP